MPRRHKGLHFYHRRKKISSALLREIFTWVFGIAVAVFIAGVSVHFWGRTTRMIGVSMEPTLTNGATVYVNRLSYLLGSPQKGDVVVFLPNGNEKSHYYVKRVVAVPGDRVQILEGRLYVNGNMEEHTSVVFDKMAEAGIAENALLLGPEEYFVLGDNRNDSEDSRSANIGMVKKDYIWGKGWFYTGGKERKIGLIK